MIFLCFLKQLKLLHRLARFQMEWLQIDDREINTKGLKPI